MERERGQTRPLMPNITFPVHPHVPTILSENTTTIHLLIYNYVLTTKLIFMRLKDQTTTYSNLNPTLPHPQQQVVWAECQGWKLVLWKLVHPLAVPNGFGLHMSQLVLPCIMPVDYPAARSNTVKVQNQAFLISYSPNKGREGSIHANPPHPGKPARCESQTAGWADF